MILQYLYIVSRVYHFYNYYIMSRTAPADALTQNLREVIREIKVLIFFLCLKKK